MPRWTPPSQLDQLTYLQALDGYVKNVSGSGGDMLKSVYDTGNVGSVDNALNLGGHPASYFAVAGAAAALTENTGAPPAASVTYRGQFYYYRPAATPGQLLFCAQTSANGSYEWIIVAQSS